MSRRRVRMVLLCEDRQHEAFVRRFFERMGWHRRSIRVLKSPRARGAGEQWVRERFPSELAAVRASHVDSSVVCVIDADVKTLAERFEDFDRACDERGVARRKRDDSVAIFIPRRNIETWIAYLDGEEVDEGAVYPKLARERDCRPHVQRLEEMCRGDQLRQPAPPSLEVACREFREYFA